MLRPQHIDHRHRHLVRGAEHWLRFALTLLLCLLAGAARAHDADLIYARLDVTRSPGAQRVQEVLTLAPGALIQLAPVDADGDRQLTQAELDAHADALAAGVWEQAPLKAGASLCTREAAAAVLKDSHVELSARFRCPEGELSQTFRLLSVLPAGFRVVADGSDQFAQGHLQTLVFLSAASARPPGKGLGEWVALGVFHIFTGIDHVAFLVALLLVGGTWRRVLLLVTSFTVAHSLTLAAAALNVVSLPSRYVEAAIAASIMYVAAENLVLRTQRHRVAITFGFGLIHGFGFASVLRELGLEQGMAQALFGFNVGVELGQACLVAVLWPLLRWVARSPVRDQWTLKVGSLVILVAGGYWLTLRLFA